MRLGSKTSSMEAVLSYFYFIMDLTLAKRANVHIAIRLKVTLFFCLSIQTIT